MYLAWPDLPTFSGQCQYGYLAKIVTFLLLGILWPDFLTFSYKVQYEGNFFPMTFAFLNQIYIFKLRLLSFLANYGI